MVVCNGTPFTIEKFLASLYETCLTGYQYKMMLVFLENEALPKWDLFLSELNRRAHMKKVSFP